MKQKKFKFSTILLLVLGLRGLQAQESVNSSGGETSNSGGTVSYATGQMAYKTHTGSNCSIVEGVQQPFEISVVTEIKKAKNISLSVSAYPNPATNFLQLKVESDELKGLSYQLYDINGKLLQSEKISGDQTSIVISKLVPASYFVKVIQGNREVKIFKIIKN